MKLTPERALELHKRGVKIDTRQIVRPRAPVVEPEPVPAPPPTEPVPELTKHLVVIAAQNAKIHSTIVEALVNIAKPKNWRCSIGRNSRGEMSTVDIKEV